MSSRQTPATRRAVPHVAAVLLTLLITLAGVATGESVSAHTAFSGSAPADGEVVADPVSSVTLVFTGESTEAGEGFVALDASGQVRAPTTVSTLDDKTFTLTFDPPLAGGQVGVRWSVRAGDNHPIEGAFSFTVTAPLPDAALSATEPASPDVAASATESASPDVAVSATAEPSTSDAATVGGPDDDMSEMSAAEMASMDDMSEMSAAEMASMNDFLAVDTSRPGESRATFGRVIGFAGISLAIGGLAFAATTFRGSTAEIRSLIRGIRVLGGAVVVGALVEYVGVTRIAGESLAGYWTSSPGVATTLRVLAGLAIVAGLTTTTVALTPRSRRTLKPLSSAPNTTDVVDTTSGFWEPTSRAATRRVEANEPPHRWARDRSSALAFVGVGLAVISFWFDGHTVSKGFRPLHAVANSVHVVAGSVWLGGVVAMATVLWSRHRRGAAPRALELVVRFSSVATVVLAAVIVAGLVMAVSVLDSFGGLTGTEWGQVLLLKTSAAFLAMTAGAYNHFRLLPALDANRADPLLHERVRSVVTAEAIMLCFVVVVTAWLVSSAS